MKENYFFIFDLPLKIPKKIKYNKNYLKIYIFLDY